MITIATALEELRATYQLPLSIGSHTIRDHDDQVVAETSLSSWHFLLLAVRLINAVYATDPEGP